MLIFWHTWPVMKLFGVWFRATVYKKKCSQPFTKILLIHVGSINNLIGLKRTQKLKKAKPILIASQNLVILQMLLLRIRFAFLVFWRYKQWSCEWCRRGYVLSLSSYEWENNENFRFQRNSNMWHLRYRCRNCLLQKWVKKLGTKMPAQACVDRIA